MAAKGFRILQFYLRQLVPRRLESATLLNYHDSHLFLVALATDTGP